MRIGTQMDAGRRAVEHILSWVEPGRDELGLFSFDRDLRQEVAFTSDPSRVRTALGQLTAVGQTSLYDAIAATAKTLGDRPSPRRAVVVITDGIDTSSSMKPADVPASRAASTCRSTSIAVLSPLDHPGYAHGRGQGGGFAGRDPPREPRVVDGRRAEYGERAGARQPGRARAGYRAAPPVSPRLRSGEGAGLVPARRENPAPRADRARPERVFRQSVRLVQVDRRSLVACRSFSPPAQPGAYQRWEDRDDEEVSCGGSGRDDGSGGFDGVRDEEVRAHGSRGR